MQSPHQIARVSRLPSTTCRYRPLSQPCLDNPRQKTRTSKVVQACQSAADLRPGNDAAAIALCGASPPGHMAAWQITPHLQQWAQHCFISDRCSGSEQQSARTTQH